MNSSKFDLVSIGGGLGGSALAISMAKRGARVLVLEKLAHFRERVRGEALTPWGVAEAKELGIADLLLRTCAKEIPWIENTLNSNFGDIVPGAFAPAPAKDRSTGALELSSLIHAGNSAMIASRDFFLELNGKFVDQLWTN